MELIAEWRCVARSTAFAYEPGRLRPSKPAAILLRLHLDRRVLSPEWRVIVVMQNAIVDPGGHEASRALLRNYYPMPQSCRELVGRIGDERDVVKWRRLLEAA